MGNVRIGLSKLQLDRLLGGSSYQVELKGPSLRRKINTGQVDKQKVLCEDSHDDK